MPAQCPSCGRFLSNDLVAGLSDDEAPCPKCGTMLTASMFDDDQTLEPPAEATTAPADDPLEGWDSGAPEVVDLAPVRPGRSDDGAVLVAAGVVGVLVGALLGRSGARRRWAMLGGLVGVVLAAVRRRLWELES